MREKRKEKIIRAMKGESWSIRKEREKEEERKALEEKRTESACVAGNPLCPLISRLMGRDVRTTDVCCLSAGAIKRGGRVPFI